MVVILVRNKAHLLNNTLKLLENQDYPKHRIGLFIRSDHNEDNTEDILETWLESQTFWCQEIGGRKTSRKNGSSRRIFTHHV